MKAFIAFILFGLLATVSHAADMVLPYNAFGPQSASYELIGWPWWQWESCNCEGRECAVNVVVYWNQTLEQTKKNYPVDKENKQDFRYVEYSAAIEYFEKLIKEMKEADFDASESKNTLIQLQNEKRKKTKQQSKSVRLASADGFPSNPFSFVGVVEGISEKSYRTIDGMKQNMVIRIVEVKTGKYSEREIGFDFPEGTKPPLEIGRTYLFGAVYDRHGIRYTEWQKIEKREDKQTPKPAQIEKKETPEQELARLNREAEAAMSQMEMNIASGNLALYWERMLQKEEAEILASCRDAKATAIFKKAQEAWREFREAEMEFWADESRGGSIQPLIRYTVYANLTEKRIQELKFYLEVPEGRHKRDQPEPARTND